MTAPNSTPAVGRLASLDVYRGFVMFLMMAEALHIGRVASAFPDSAFWKFLDFHTSHVEWVGCSLHDMIQPSFSFLVGVALPFSIASRMARGQSGASLFGHALWRSLVLILLGVFLRSVGASQTNWTFEDTLTQIGLGYPFLFLAGSRSARVQFVALLVVLVGYWVAWALYPVAGPGFDYARVGVPPDWAHHANGIAAHWNKNANLGSAFDQWFMNLFPRAKEFVANRGGYLTLSFIPTLGTMLLGALAGGWLRSNLSHAAKLKRLLLAAAICLAGGLALHLAGLCPIVKRIWTPSWALFSGGVCFVLMAAFYAVADGKGGKVWAFPFTVIGMNSIAAYCIAHLWDGFVSSSFRTHFGVDVFKVFGEAYAPLVQGAAVMGVFWVILWWMHGRRLFLRI